MDKYKSLQGYQELAKKLDDKVGTPGYTLSDFTDDILDAYNQGILEKQDFIKIMDVCVNNKHEEYLKSRGIIV